MVPLALVLCSLLIHSAYGISYELDGSSRYELPDYGLSDAWLKEIVDKIDSDFEPADYLNVPTKDNVVERHPQLLDENLFSGRVTKEENANSGYGFGSDSRFLKHPKEQSIRDHEYIQHSTLWGNQYVAGGAGEGNQHLKPDGSLKNTQEVKTDSVLPAYCNPPNPCPVGYTEANGCITEFQNSASFSRQFQAAQECMCDSEHMFDCPVTSDRTSTGLSHNRQPSDKQIDTLAQSISNQGLNADNIDELLKEVEGSHPKSVSKKHFNGENNPYLQGVKLPVQAKKSPSIY